MTDPEWDVWCALMTRLVFEVAIVTDREPLNVVADVRKVVEQRVTDLHRHLLRSALPRHRQPSPR